MFNNKKIFIAGHQGMVGSAILEKMIDNGHSNFLLKPFSELDLRNQRSVTEFFELHKPDIVILAAAKVGGINANIQQPIEFLYDNLMIQNNVLMSATNTNVEKFVFIGSSCIYPCKCPQPMKEEYLLDGKLEPTNEGYALAKICGIKLGEYLCNSKRLNVLNLIPCNLYGPNDSYDPEYSHVFSSLVRKIVDSVENKQEIVKFWGTGIARREFMHVDDLADAVLFFLNKDYSTNMINIGWGKDISIKELAEKIAIQVGYKGQLQWDASKPDGMLQKCLDVNRMRTFGFLPKISLSEGISNMVMLYRELKKIR